MPFDIATIAAILDIVAVIGAAGAAAWYAFNNQKSTLRAADDTVSSNLIQNLKTTTDLQEKTIGQLSLKLDTTTKELHQMQGRNEMLEKLFNGSEGSILAFLKEAPKLVRIADENNALAKSTNDEIKHLTTELRALVGALSGLDLKPAAQLDITP